MEWRPNKRQEIALKMRKVKELFYGGARGGGKTIFLLVDFLQGLNEWGEDWTGILFRQTYSQLEEVVREAKRLYIPLGGEFHKAENYFSFPNGAVIKFRYLESDGDCEDYQGHSYTWIGFDELGNYRTDYAWITMMMCLRSSRVPEGWIRIRGTGNPGGVGHKWLKARFIEGKAPCEVYTETVGHDLEGKPIMLSRSFVPATVADNTVLMKNNPTYLANLMAQPERIRKAMLEGSWDIKGGGEFFDQFDSAVHVISPRLLKGDWKRFYAMDWGFKSPYAVVKLAVNPDGMVIVYGEIYGQGTVEGVEKENVGTRESSETVALRVAEDMAIEGVTECVADYNMWEQKFSVVSPVDAFFNAGIDMIKADKKRGIGWQNVHDLLNDKDEFGTPYLRIFSTCKYLIREMENLQCDKNNPEEPDGKQADHALDALRYGLNSDLYRRGGETMPAVYSAAAGKAFTYDPLKSAYWSGVRG